MCPQVNAHEEAELEVRRQQELQREETRRREEQLEKARIRGRQALKREQLVQVTAVADTRTHVVKCPAAVLNKK